MHFVMISGKMGILYGIGRRDVKGMDSRLRGNDEKADIINLA